MSTCHNRLYLVGPKTALNKCRQRMRSRHGPLDFRRIHAEPDPATLAPGKPRRFFSADEWRRQYWGTRENAIEPTVEAWPGEGQTERMVLKFDTEAAPPMPVLRALSRLCPDITLALVWVKPTDKQAGTVLMKDTRKLFHRAFDQTTDSMLDTRGPLSHLAESALDKYDPTSGDHP